MIVLDTRFNTPLEVTSDPSPGSEFHRFVSLAINCVRRPRDGVYMFSSLFHLSHTVHFLQGEAGLVALSDRCSSFMFLDEKTKLSG